MKVPNDRQQIIGRKELRYSLKTGYLGLAKKKAGGGDIIGLPMDENKALETIIGYLESQFPKACLRCGMVYKSLAEYLRNTTELGDPISYDLDIGNWKPKKPLGTFSYRNCNCGSTLSLSSHKMKQLTLWRLLIWARVEASQREMSVKQYFRYLRSELRRKVLDEPDDS